MDDCTVIWLRDGEGKPSLKNFSNAALHMHHGHAVCVCHAIVPS